MPTQWGAVHAAHSSPSFARWWPMCRWWRSLRRASSCLPRAVRRVTSAETMRWRHWCTQQSGNSWVRRTPWVRRTTRARRGRTSASVSPTAVLPQQSLRSIPCIREHRTSLLPVRHATFLPTRRCTHWCSAWRSLVRWGRGFRVPTMLRRIARWCHSCNDSGCTDSVMLQR